MWALRVLLLTISLAISVLLIARGNVVLGVLIGAAALLRGAMFVHWQRRRSELRRRFEGRWGRPR